MWLLDRIVQRLRRFDRVLRYIFAGSVVTLAYSGIVSVLQISHTIDDRVLASVCASAVTIPASFIIHRATTYRDTRLVAAQWPRFVLIGIANLFINAGLMKISEPLHWPFWIALVIGWVVIPIANYLLNALWVFRPKRLWAVDR